MGEIVNRTFEVAMGWQQAVVWIRMNVGFIKAEVPYLEENGHDTAELDSLVTAFGETFSRFCEEELELFVLARRTEVDGDLMAGVIAKLQGMRESFRPWLTTYHGLVQKTRAENPGSLPLSLLLGCGAELHQAHTAFINAVDDYANELKGRTSRTKASKTGSKRGGY